MLKIQIKEKEIKEFKNLYLRCIKGIYFGNIIKLNNKLTRISNRNEYKPDYNLEIDIENSLDIWISNENQKIEINNNGDIDIFYALKSNQYELNSKNIKFMIDNNILEIENINEFSQKNINYLINTLKFKLDIDKLKVLKICSLTDLNNLKISELKEIVFNNNNEFSNLLSIINNQYNLVNIKYKGEESKYYSFNEIMKNEFIIRKVENKLVIQFDNNLFKKRLPLIYVNKNNFKFKPGEYIKISNNLDFVLENFEIGFYSNIGNKNKNEDRILILNNIKCDNSFKFSIYAVFDGHNGALCSEFCMNKLKLFLVKNINKKNNLNILYNDYIKNNNNQFITTFKKIITETFIQLDLYFYYKFEEHSFKIGSTCNANIILDDNTIFNINLGDSKTIKFNSEFKPIELSKDHNYLNSTEIKRVNNFGGQFIKGRINGNLAVSRSFGDFIYKKDLENNIFADYIVSSDPDISIYKFNKNEILLISSDGLFDVYNNYDDISKILLEDINKNLSLICKDLYERCIQISKERNEKCDNISIILIKA